MLVSPSCLMLTHSSHNVPTEHGGENPRTTDGPSAEHWWLLDRRVEGQNRLVVMFSPQFNPRERRTRLSRDDCSPMLWSAAKDGPSGKRLGEDFIPSFLLTEQFSGHGNASPCMKHPSAAENRDATRRPREGGYSSPSQGQGDYVVRYRQPEKRSQLYDGDRGLVWAQHSRGH